MGIHHLHKMLEYFWCRPVNIDRISLIFTWRFFLRVFMILVYVADHQWYHKLKNGLTKTPSDMQFLDWTWTANVISVLYQ